MLIGILWVVPSTVINYGVTTVFSKKAILVDAIYHLVEQGAGGIVIALIYGKLATGSRQDEKGSEMVAEAGASEDSDGDDQV